MPISFSESLEQLSLRQGQKPRRAYNIPINSSPLWAQPFDVPSSPPWDEISLALRSPTTSSDRYPFHSKSFSDAGSSVIGDSLSRSESLNRELEDDNHNYSFSLPSCQALLSRDEYSTYSYVKPEPGEDGAYPSRPNPFLPQDLITEKLNSLRKSENKNPLPPLEGLFDASRGKHHMTNDPYRQFHNQEPHKRIFPQEFHVQPYEQRSPPRERRRRRTSPLKAHCNIKYLVEELDYIRYQRVDLAQQWPVVEAKFSEKFPMAFFPKQRERQGLQGVNYRQNKCLPRLRNGQLVFMKNGHVDPVCTKTREQTEKKHLYTLVYLFPDRAMKYSWVSSVDRRRAAELNVDRQRQLHEGRLKAKKRGTYVEELPPDSKCGCCPGKDRQRDTARSEKKCVSEFQAKL
ncbi:hypothetical protein GGS21DRAFT_475237 [Xylaria nigripes]|nr:hypothetical protein GGS21DRAFT_475237 [Xylaria nigripes]